MTLRLPFCSDGLDKTIRRIIRNSRLPIRITYVRPATLTRRLIQSNLSPRHCAVHEKFVEEYTQEQKRRGKPRNDCISCQAGVKEEYCDKRGAIYLLKRVFCSEEYIGETQRPLRIWLQEHQLQARNRSRYTPWGEHIGSHANEEVAKKPVFSAEILAIESSATTRKARETIEIRDRKPTINRNRGWSVL